MQKMLYILAAIFFGLFTSCNQLDKNPVDALNNSETKEFADQINNNRDQNRPLPVELKNLHQKMDIFAKEFAKSLHNARFMNEISKMYNGYEKYAIKLNDLSPELIEDLAKSCNLEVKEFEKTLCAFPASLELFLPPWYENIDWNDLQGVVYVPLIDEEELTILSGYDVKGNIVEVDAWEDRMDFPVLVLRVNEREMLEKKGIKYITVPFGKNNSHAEFAISITDTSHITGITSSQFQSLSVFKAQVYNWEEPCWKWPPELYTKTWVCNNESCTNFSWEQQSYLPNPYTSWDPPVTSCGDTQVHYVNPSHTNHVIWSGNTLWEVNLWRVELIEDDNGGDDLIDRFYPKAVTQNSSSSLMWGVYKKAKLQFYFFRSY